MPFVNVKMNQDLFNSIDRLAKQKGISRSKLVKSILKDNLPHMVKRKKRKPKGFFESLLDFDL
jgi:metal-responsive CopG/Arc/MetJ family transcriptional regulator